MRNWKVLRDFVLLPNYFYEASPYRASRTRIGTRKHSLNSSHIASGRNLTAVLYKQQGYISPDRPASWFIFPQTAYPGP